MSRAVVEDILINRYHEKTIAATKSLLLTHSKDNMSKKGNESSYLGSEEQFTIIIFCCTSQGKKLYSHYPYTHSNGNLHLMLL